MQREFTKYVECGVLAHGFARVRCGDCGNDLLVAFSCKGRGVCPSCTTRRAHDTAAHLVDAVLPAVPLRQWVLTFPRRVRFAFARKPALVSAALAIFQRALATWIRRRARRDGEPGKPGAITFVQRFGSALQLNIHFHVVVPDGVFVEDPAADGGAAAFRSIEPPDDDDVRRLLETTARRIVRMLERKIDEHDLDPDDTMASLEVAALAAGPHGHDPPAHRRLSAFLEGFSLHAATKVHENDRQGRERLCLYGARGPLALSRLEEVRAQRQGPPQRRAARARRIDDVTAWLDGASPRRSSS